MRHIELQHMSQNAIEIAQFAVAATTEAAAKEHNAKVEEILEPQECIERRHREELGRLKSAHRQEKKQLDQEKLMGKCRGLRHTTCTAVCMNHFYTEYRFRLIKQSATLFHPHFSSRIINTLVLFFP